MRINLKLTLAIALSIAFILSVFGYSRVQNDLAIYDSDIRRDHRNLARALAIAASVVADRSGVKEAIDFIKDTNTREERLLISWIPDSSVIRAKNGSPRMGIPYSLTVASEGEERGFLVTQLPVRLDQNATGRIELRESLRAERDNTRATVTRSVLMVIVNIAVCTAVILSFGWWFVGRPIRLLVAKLRRIGEGDFSEPLHLRQRDEMADLAREINGMCDQLTAANDRAKREMEARIVAIEQLRHADRLSTVGRLASGIAHELGTPLNVISAHAKMIFRGQTKGQEVLDDAKVIAEQSDKIANIIRQLLDFARRRPLNKTRQDLRALTTATFRLLESMASKRKVALEMIDGPEKVMAEIDGTQIQQVLTNLVLNAIQAQPHGGVVRVRLEEYTRNTGARSDNLQIIVEDDGPGLTPELAQKVFEPFFTTKDVGEGTGLGLSVAYGIVHEHGGALTVESSPGTGSRFIMTLPNSSSPVEDVEQGREQSLT